MITEVENFDDSNKRARTKKNSDGEKGRDVFTEEISFV